MRSTFPSASYPACGDDRMYDLHHGLLSGGVTFTLDGTQVSASEADVDLLSGTISLRGDVSMKMNIR